MAVVMSKCITRKCRRCCFSLVEVVLALGIMGVGLIQIMRLFPVGLNSVREAVAERYAADSADHFLHMFALQLKNPADGHANWEKYGMSLPVSKPEGEEPGAEDWSLWLSAASSRCWLAKDTTSYVKVEQRSPDADVADFSAIYRVWRDSVNYWRFEDGVWKEDEVDAGDAMGVNVEVSWPSTIPYSQRQTALYRLEVFRSQ